MSLFSHFICCNTTLTIFKWKNIILPKDHYSLEHLAHFVMGATNNFCTLVQHCLVLLRVWVTWRDTNSCKQQSNQCPICYYGPLTWTYVATSFTLCQASARGHESPRKGPIFWGKKMKKEKSCYGKKWHVGSYETHSFTILSHWLTYN